MLPMLRIDLSRPASVAAALVALLAGLAGCGTHIGDSCTQSTDCSVQGNRQCDISQTGGYCTIFNCAANSCPDNAVCTDFGIVVAGCGYTDYLGQGRTARSLCMATCGSTSDCRAGYVCEDPRGFPWYADVLDQNQGGQVCIIPASMNRMGPGDAGGGPAAVCGASVPFPDASSDAEAEQSGDALPDADAGDDSTDSE